MATKRVAGVADSINRVKPAKKRKQERRKQPRINYDEIEKENKLFEEFYTKQGILSPSEWDHFLDTVKLPLPATFRITSDTRVSRDLAKCLTYRYIQNFPKLSASNDPINPPTPISWYPDNLAWHVDISKKEIRNDPVLAGYHAFLMRETGIGNVSRQEAVSMIPPLFLDIQSHHKVLDMCAAPGSKTTQIIEALHQSHSELKQSLADNSATNLVPNPLPSGFVVANDSDNKRSYLLVHQAKRKKSANVLVTNNDGTVFPNLYLSEEDRKAGNHVLFDRVLCDVPCSGDGTMRKNPTIWLKWSPARGNGLHRLQLRLAVRGAELLVNGGKLVYSTCSMNPIENEAVIHTLLRLGEGALELLDVSSSLSGFKKRSGLKWWRVMSNASVWVESQGAEEKQDGIYSTFFPPTSEKADFFQLWRCMRVYPHLQNTGGFFIAVIQKVSPLPWLKSKSISVDAPIVSSEAPEVKYSEETFVKGAIKNRPFEIFGKFATPSGFKGYREDPFIFVKRSDDLIAAMTSIYGLPDNFPWDQCFTRSEGKAKNNIYITNPLITKILATSQADKNTVKVINTGLRVFCRSDQSTGSPSRLRFSQDGCNVLFEYISKRKVPIAEVDLVKLLQNESVSLNDFSTEGRAGIKDMSIGPVVLVYTPAVDSAKSHTSATVEILPGDVADKSDEKALFQNFVTSPLIFSGWKANWSVRLFVAKEEKQHYLVMLGFDLKSDVNLEEKKMSRFIRCQNREANEPILPEGPITNVTEHEPLITSDNLTEDT